MSHQRPVSPRAVVRRILSWALVSALCVAALTAIVAVLNGDFDETAGRVLATSLGFAVFSATAASGASLRFRDSVNLRTLGLATMAVSAVAFVLLPLALWNDGNDDAWRWFGCAGLGALASSHASLVSGARRGTDSPAIQGLAHASIALGVVDAFFAILAVSGAVDRIDETFGQLMAVLVILLLLTTALPPILRRLHRSAGTSGLRVDGQPGLHESAPLDRGTRELSLASEVVAAVDRIEALNGDPGNRAPEIRRECQRLRELARSHSG